MDKYRKIIKKIAISGTIENIVVLNTGHINDSYVLCTKEKNTPNYLLQRINHDIFENVDILQNNIKLVTDHIRKKLTEKGESDIDFKVLTMIPTKDNKLYYYDGESY